MKYYIPIGVALWRITEPPKEAIRRLSSVGASPSSGWRVLESTKDATFDGDDLIHRLVVGDLTYFYFQLPEDARPYTVIEVRQDKVTVLP